MTTERAVDLLGTGCTTREELLPRARALAGRPGVDGASGETYLAAATHAEREWTGYVAEAGRRRELREAPGMTDLVAAAHTLMGEVNAYLDGNDDEDMQADADALDAEVGRGVVRHETALALLEEVDAYLDGNDDEDMQAAAEALREIVGTGAEPPSP